MLRWAMTSPVHLNQSGLSVASSICVGGQLRVAAAGRSFHDRERHACQPLVPILLVGTLPAMMPFFLRLERTCALLSGQAGSRGMITIRFRSMEMGRLLPPSSVHGPTPPVHMVFACPKTPLRFHEDGQVIYYYILPTCIIFH